MLDFDRGFSDDLLGEVSFELNEILQGTVHVASQLQDLDMSSVQGGKKVSADTSRICVSFSFYSSLRAPRNFHLVDFKHNF